MSTKPTTEQRARALAKHLDLDETELTGIEDSGGGVFEYGREEYRVLTDAEADDLAKDDIRSNAWAFNASFIAAHTRDNRAQEALQKAQGELCEDANDLVLSMIADFDHFAADAIKSDGRGHFLATYDGEETEVRVDGQTFYIYRVN